MWIKKLTIRYIFTIITCLYLATVQSDALIIKSQALKRDCSPITLTRTYSSNYCNRSSVYKLEVRNRYSGECYAYGDCQSSLKCCSKDGAFCAWEDKNGINCMFNGQTSSWKTENKHIDSTCGGLASQYMCITKDEYWGCVI
jgi:hypothetical protein